MIIAGLTGGIASGKTTVSRQFKCLGAYLIDADELGHKAIAPGTGAWEAIKKIFGSVVINPDHTINRKILGEIVFGDKSKREVLNSIVHPVISKAQETLSKEIAMRDPNAVIIYDAALLIETGAHRRMDKIILVAADHRSQIKRIKERDGFPQEKAERRIASQATIKEREKCADFIIDSLKPPADIEREVSTIFEKLKSLA